MQWIFCGRASIGFPASITKWRSKGTLGEETSAFLLNSECLANVYDFKKAMMARGNYIWRGGTRALDDLCELLFKETNRRRVYELERYGKIDRDLWVFRNAAVAGGAIIMPDADEIFWADESRGFFLRVPRYRGLINPRFHWMDLYDRP